MKLILGKKKNMMRSGIPAENMQFKQAQKICKQNSPHFVIFDMQIEINMLPSLQKNFNV